MGPLLEQAYDAIFLSADTEDIEENILVDRIAGEAAAYLQKAPRFAKILPEINQELDALQGWSLSKQTDSDFKDSYIRAVQALALQKIISEENGALLKNILLGIGDDLTLGLLGLESFAEDASKIRKKILDALKQEVEEAFADNLIFSEQNIF